MMLLDAVVFSGLILDTASVCAAITQLPDKKKAWFGDCQDLKNHKIPHASHLDVLNTAQVADLSIYLCLFSLLNTIWMLQQSGDVSSNHLKFIRNC